MEGLQPRRSLREAPQLTPLNHPPNTPTTITITQKDGTMTDTTINPNTPTSRRGMLRSAAGLAVAAAAGAGAVTLADADDADADAYGKSHLVLDVATRFSTFRVSVADGVDEPSPLGVPRGSSFLLEGEIFEGGTIDPGEMFDLEANLHKRIGHWFCWGNLISFDGRPDPHVVSTQEYVLGSIEPTSPFPPDKLMSGGAEGAFDPATNPQMRAVIGGTGTHAGATGQVAQFLIGQNTDVDADGLNSSTLRFSFDIRTGRHGSIETLTRRAGLI